jgi:hypothetical protein
MDKEARPVSRAIALALALIADQDRELAQLLSKSIESGQYLSYSPPPASPRRKPLHAKKPRPRRGKDPLQPGGR